MVAYRLEFLQCIWYLLKNLLITVISLRRSVITQGRFAGGLGQEFTEYILLGPASTDNHFISN